MSPTIRVQPIAVLESALDRLEFGRDGRYLRNPRSSTGEVNRRIRLDNKLNGKLRRNEVLLHQSGPQPAADRIVYPVFDAYQRIAKPIDATLIDLIVDWYVRVQGTAVKPDLDIRDGASAHAAERD